MIPANQLAQLTAQVIMNVAMDKLHRRVNAEIRDAKGNPTDISLKCGWSGDDIVLKIKNIRGQVSGQTIATPPKKKIILPAGVHGSTTTT